MVKEKIICKDCEYCHVDMDLFDNDIDEADYKPLMCDLWHTRTFEENSYFAAKEAQGVADETQEINRRCLKCLQRL